MKYRIPDWVSCRLIICLWVLYGNVLGQTGLNLKINFGNEPVDSVLLGQSTYLDAAIKFADAMLAHGRKNNGLFYRRLSLTSPPSGGTVGEPNVDQEVYRLLWYLGEATGDATYSNAADKGLRYFMRTTGYGLFAWGEGGGSVVENDVLPIIHYDMWRLHPESMGPSAYTYWELGIRNKTTGDWDRHMPNSSDYGPFARHAGNFVSLWLDAYTRTGDRAFLEHAALLCQYNHGLMVYNDQSSPSYNDTYDGVTNFPGSPTNYWGEAMDQGIVFQYAVRRHLHRLLPDAEPELTTIRNFLQASAQQMGTYGGNNGFLRRLPANEAQLASVYYQLMDDGQYALANQYKQGLINAVDRAEYRQPTGSPHSGEALLVGAIIRMQLACYKITDDDLYLNRAIAWADHGIAQFMTNQDIPSNTPGGTVYGRTSGGSSGGNTTAGLPMALFLLGMEIEHPNHRLLYIGTPN